MLKKTLERVTKLARQIRDDFYESEKILGSMIGTVYFKQYQDTVCLRCGKGSKVELCKQCDY